MAGDSFRNQLVARLRYQIGLRGMSVARVEKELGRSRGFLGDALRGGKRLPIETILEVLDLLRIEPARFFAGDAPEGRGWTPQAAGRAAAAEVAERRGDGGPRPMRERPGGDPIEIDELARTLRAVVRLLDEKGYLSREELTAALSSADGLTRRS